MRAMAKTIIISRILLFDNLFILWGVFILPLNGRCFDAKPVLYIQNQRILQELQPKNNHKIITIE